MNKHLLRGFGTFLTLCLIFFTGCELFNNKPEGDLEKQIDEAVDIANAPVLNVAVDEGGMGTASPRGTLSGIKQGVPFSLNYVPKNEYPFYGWQARLEGSEDLIATWTPEGASGADKVEWVPQNIMGTEVQVTIHINPGNGKIIIGPIGANAPVVNVEVANTMTGTVSPTGTLTGIKQGIPFRLNFSINPNFGFIRWAASLEGGELEQDQVEFSAPTQLETMVTIHINPGKKTVVITPLGEGANSTNDFYVFPEPVESGTSPVYRLVPQEHYMEIRFSKPIAPASIRFENGKNFGGTYIDSWLAYTAGGGSPYLLPINNPPKTFEPQGIFDTEFKNITIKGSVNPPFGYRGFYLENFFYPPLLSVDGKTLFLWTRPLRGGMNDGKPVFQALTYSGGGWWDNNHLTITVTIDGAIQDESGLAMGISKSFSYQATGNGGVTGVPAYTSTISYGTGNIFPNGYGGNACMILEEKARGSVINVNDMINVTGTNHFEVPADGRERWVYVLFQAFNTRWRVVGARIVDRDGFAENAAYVPQNQGWVDGWVTGSDVPLLGENLPEEPSVSSVLQDAVLRDKLTAAYRQKMQSNPTGYSDALPVYVVRYRLQGHTSDEFVPAPLWSGDIKTLQAFARVGVEPPLSSFPIGVTSPSGFGNNVNRAPYPSSSGTWLYVRYVAP